MASGVDMVRRGNGVGWMGGGEERRCQGESGKSGFLKERSPVTQAAAVSVVSVLPRPLVPPSQGRTPAWDPLERLLTGCGCGCRAWGSCDPQCHPVVGGWVKRAPH